MNDAELFSDRVRELAQRIAESGPVALAGLFDLTSQRLVRFATTITHNQHDGEDAVQSTLASVASEPRWLCQSDQPWPYLLRMVRNESLVIMRKKKRWSLLTNISDLLTQRSVDAVELEDSHRAVWAALRLLPVDQSQVVVLKIWEEMTFSEIASVLEIPTATAASRYRYAIEKLTTLLRSHDAEVSRE